MLELFLKFQLNKIIHLIGRRRQTPLLNLKLHPLGMYFQHSALITKQRELLTIKEFSAGLTALAN